MSAVLVAVVGAESTGKTTLALQVAQALQGRGLDAVVVPETLRDFCVQHGRTPHVHEQADIARAHSDRIEHALGQHQVVLADTTALMTAVYSEFVFGDRSLYEPAVLAHRRADLTLLTSLDLPWEADGLQRFKKRSQKLVELLVNSQEEYVKAITGQQDAKTTMNNIPSPDTTDAGIERLIQAKGKTAPRITPAGIEANIASEWYFTGADGAAGAALSGTPYAQQPPVPADHSLRLLTFCDCRTQPGSIALQQPRLLIVFQIRQQTLLINTFFQCGVFNWKTGFNTVK